MTVSTYPTFPRTFFQGTPPPNPQHGDQWILPLGANQDQVWRFIYNLAAASANKWQFIGGTRLSSVDRSFLSDTVVSSWATFGAGPRITVPRAGDYEVSANVEVLNTTASSALAAMSAGVGGIGPMQIDATVPTGSTRLGMTVGGTLTGLALGANIDLFMWTTVSGLQYGERSMWVSPLRVS